MWNLRELVDRYLTLVDGYGKPAPLVAFGLPAFETTSLFSAFEEDYHISRYLHFSRNEGASYLIGGELATHVAIDPSIHEAL